MDVPGASLRHISRLVVQASCSQCKRCSSSVAAAALNTGRRLCGWRWRSASSPSWSVACHDFCAQVWQDWSRMAAFVVADSSAVAF